MTWGFKKCTSLQDLSILLQHVAGCLGMLVQCARQNYFLNEKSISSSEILTSYWQLVSKIIPIQWTQVKTQSAYPRRRSNIILNMCSGCWGNKWPVVPMKFPSDSIGNNSKVQIPPGLLSKHADWCVPGDLVHAVNPLKLWANTLFSRVLVLWEGKQKCSCGGKGTQLTAMKQCYVGNSKSHLSLSLWH